MSRILFDSFDSSAPVFDGRSVSGLPRAEQDAAEAGLFGKDIWYDISSDQTGNGEGSYVITPGGDVQTASGREALRQSLVRRTITAPEDWPTLPGYGVGAGAYVKAKNTPATRAELEGKIRSQYLRDPRVDTVDLVLLTPLDDGSPGIKISVSVSPRGRLRTDRPLSVQVEIR